MVELFIRLASKKHLIEETYGGPLVWEELPGKRACRVADYAIGDVVNGDSFDEYIDWFLDSGDRLRKAVNAALASDDLQLDPSPGI